MKPQKDGKLIEKDYCNTFLIVSGVGIFLVYYLFYFIFSLFHFFDIDDGNDSYFKYWFRIYKIISNIHHNGYILLIKLESFKVYILLFCLNYNVFCIIKTILSSDEAKYHPFNMLKWLIMMDK